MTRTGNDGERRRDPFWDEFADILKAAGLDEGASGSAKAAIHHYIVAPIKLKFGEGRGAGHDKKGMEPRETSQVNSQPIYGENGVRASILACLQRLVDRLGVEFGRIKVDFADGVVSEVRVTVKIRPDEDEKVGQLARPKPRRRRGLATPRRHVAKRKLR